MIKTVEIGEIETEMIGDISTADVMNVYLRIGWGAETTSRIAFKPAEDLNTGDGIRVTIEKVYVEPDPEPEPEVEKEAATDEVAEAPKVEGGEETPAGEASETSATKAESGEEGGVSETAEAAPEVEGGEEGTAEKL
jgi:hypothetical protein